MISAKFTECIICVLLSYFFISLLNSQFMSCHSTFAQNKNSETKEHNIKKIYWTPFLFILKSCSNKQLFCNVSKTNGIQSVIESEQHVINNQALSDHWCFETIMHHKITPKAWEKKCTFCILPLVKFYLQTSIFEQGIAAISQKVRN